MPEGGGGGDNGPSGALWSAIPGGGGGDNGPSGADDFDILTPTQLEARRAHCNYAAGGGGGGDNGPIGALLDLFIVWLLASGARRLAVRRTAVKNIAATSP